MACEQAASDKRKKKKEKRKKEKEKKVGVGRSKAALDQEQQAQRVPPCIYCQAHDTRHVSPPRAEAAQGEEGEGEEAEAQEEAAALGCVPARCGWLHAPRRSCAPAACSPCPGKPRRLCPVPQTAAAAATPAAAAPAAAAATATATAHAGGGRSIGTTRIVTATESEAASELPCLPLLCISRDPCFYFKLFC